MDDVLTVYKLIVLYMLDRSEEDLTQAALSAFLLENGYANFVSLAKSYSQLEKQGLVLPVNEGGKRFLRLTEEGRQALGFFGRQLSEDIRVQADEWILQNGSRLREERQVGAVFQRMTTGAYEVQMYVRERDTTLVDIRLSLPDQSSASAVAAKWSEKNTEIYQYLISKLF